MLLLLRKKKTIKQGKNPLLIDVVVRFLVNCLSLNFRSGTVSLIMKATFLLPCIFLRFTRKEAELLSVLKCRIRKSWEISPFPFFNKSLIYVLR